MNVKKTSSNLMTPYTDFITNRSGRGCNSFKILASTHGIKPGSGNEVRKIIKDLRPNKDPGYDGVTNSMLKQLPCHFINIFNSPQRLQHFTVNWMKAKWSQFSSQRKTHQSPQ